MSDYDTDLLLWNERQADLLRRVAAGERVKDHVDWENVAEEIEALGRSDRRELTNQGTAHRARSRDRCVGRLQSSTGALIRGHLLTPTIRCSVHGCHEGGTYG